MRPFSRFFHSSTHWHSKFNRIHSTALRIIPMATLSALAVTSPPSPSSDSKKEGRPAHHLNDTKDSFTNPWPSFHAHGPSTYIKSFFTVGPQMARMKAPTDISKQLPVIKPTWGAGADPSKIKATWLGHACFLVELPTPPNASRGPRILFDPVFSHRCSPVQFMGPARYTPMPCEISEIPDVDAVVISHNHYDHLDTHTIQTLRTRPSPPHIFAPLGNESYFSSLSIPESDYTCLDWWEARDCSALLPGASGASGASTGKSASSAGVEGKEGEGVKAGFRVTCTPAQHFTGRGIRDRFKSLWASWAVESLPLSSTPTPTPTSNTTITTTTATTSATTTTTTAPTGVKIWFGGDTGYRYVPSDRSEDDMPTCPAFKEIGTTFGGFDLALIPIGAYLPREVMSPVHCAPQDSVLVFQDVKARRALGIHWGTWILTTEPILEPPQLLKEACKKVGIPEGVFGTCDAIGETVVV